MTSAPQVKTEEPTEVEAETATFHGEIASTFFELNGGVLREEVEPPTANPPISECEFEYGTSTSYGETVPCEPPPPYSPTVGQVAEVHVSAAVGGLTPGTAYHVRIMVADEMGDRSYGQDVTFTTTGRGPPAIDGESSVATAHGATLLGRINPDGYETTCTAEYVTDGDFQESEYAKATTLPCSPQKLAAGFGERNVSVALSGLELGTVYHFRFIAANQAGTTIGEDRRLATFAIESFSFGPEGEAGEPYAQAGGHPYALTDSFTLSTTIDPWGKPNTATMNVRDIHVELPPGMVGNPEAAPKCAPYHVAHADCPGATQVGMLAIYTNRFPKGYHVPLYNLVPPEGLAAQFGVRINGFVTAHIDASVRSGTDYGVRGDALYLSAMEGLTAASATLWGVPTDPSHDSERFCPAGSFNERAPCALEDSERSLTPFLRNPTSCPASRATTMRVHSWQAPESFAEASSPFPAMEGCDEVPFEPGFTLTPTRTEAASPTGLHVDLHLPQPEGVGAPGQADLRKAVVALPRGLHLNPAGAGGLAACSEAQFGFAGREGAAIHTTAAPARCPRASKIGRVEVATPLLEHPLKGGVYVAAPHENPFGSLLAIYSAVEDPKTGVVVKLAGEVQANPQTGQLTTTFDESPQLPFEDFKLDFFSGPRAPLKTAATCGTFTTTTDLTPWSAPQGADATPSSSFEVASGPNGAPCSHSAAQEPNGPSFDSGTLDPRAGSHSSFVLRLARGDGSQRLKGISVTLPPGLTGRLAGIPYCSERQIDVAASRAGRYESAHPDCPYASQVGTVTVAAGAGSMPLQVDGRAYLAGPYRGAPLSLAIVTPAVAGPFDLGTVVVRTALYIDPKTAQITAKSDPIPTILEGIPLDVRSIAVKMNRPNLTLNPTSCDPMTIVGSSLSVLDRPAPLAERFQVGGCEGLPFAPQLTLNLRGATRRTGHPALEAVLTAQPGEANVARAQVALPRSEFLDQSRLKTICTNVQFDEGGGNGERCPAGSIYGFARAQTPLLDHPLEGLVYLRSSTHSLPDLVAALSGPPSQPVAIDLVGRIDSVHGGIRTTFEAVPDAPVSVFALNMRGGKNGLLVNSTDLCGKRHRARVAMEGHNGKLFRSRAVLSNSACRKHRKKKRHHRRHAHHRHRHSGAARRRSG